MYIYITRSSDSSSRHRPPSKPPPHSRSLRCSPHSFCAQFRPLHFAGILSANLYVYILLLRHKPESPPSNLNPRPQGGSLREAWEEQRHSLALRSCHFAHVPVLPPPCLCAVLPRGPAPLPETCPPPRASVLHFHSATQRPSPSPSPASPPACSLTPPCHPPTSASGAASCPRGPTFGSKFDPSTEQPFSEEQAGVRGVGVPQAALRGIPSSSFFLTEGRAAVQNVPSEAGKRGCEAPLQVPVMPQRLGPSVSHPRGRPGGKAAPNVTPTSACEQSGWWNCRPPFPHGPGGTQHRNIAAFQRVKGEHLASWNCSSGPFSLNREMKLTVEGRNYLWSDPVSK